MGQAHGGIIPVCGACGRCDFQHDEVIAKQHRLHVGSALTDFEPDEEEVQYAHMGAAERDLPPPFGVVEPSPFDSTDKRSVEEMTCGQREHRPHRVLRAFVQQMQAGVGLSLLLDGVGVLLVEAKLKVGSDPALVLCFNSMKRYVPLDDVEDIVVERAHADSGAWLVRMVLDATPMWTFLFDGTKEGRQAAVQLGYGLRLLVENTSCGVLRSEDEVAELLRFAPTALGCPAGGKRDVTFRPSCDVRTEIDAL
mmetsp:Transcript_120203/g.347371  ORF Transcript_120203/g.347371 Transcript_120203/m.347371 type:complete len:252 (-) Transcript_120203:71-826(-)